MTESPRGATNPGANVAHPPRIATLQRAGKRLRTLPLVALVLALVAAGGLAPAFDAPARAQTGVTWTHTLVADFRGCGIDNGASVTNVAGGEVRLPALIEDYFDGSTLDTARWIGDDVSVAGGILTVGTDAATGSIRSIASVDEGDLPLAVEGRIRFVNGGSFYADFGLGKPSEVAGSPNVLFISDAEANVYANDYQPGDSGPWRTEITGVAWNEYQEVRIELYNDWVDYYVDGELQEGHELETSMFPSQYPNLYLWLYNINDNPGYPVNADWVRVARYPADDEYLSCPIDAGQSVTWGVLGWDGDLPAGTAAVFQTRTWDDAMPPPEEGWEVLDDGGEILSGDGRYLQYRILLSTTDRTLSPEVQEVQVYTGSIENGPPVAYNQDLSTLEGSPLDIILTGSDPDMDLLSYSVVTGPANGVLSGFAPDLTYTPDTDYYGTDSFTFRVHDGLVFSNLATVEITVTPDNNPPVANDQEVSTDQDTPVDITLTATDPDGNPLTYSVVDLPANGTLSGTEPDLTYTPDTGFDGSDSFTFRANDGIADSNLATVDITVIPSASAPVAEDDTDSTDEDTAVTTSVLDNDEDPEGAPLSVASVGTPDIGAATTDGTTVTYTPENRTAPYTAIFQYTATNGDESDMATVSVYVDADDDPPDMENDNDSTDEDTPVAIAVLDNDQDPEGASLSVASVGTPNLGTATTNGTTVTYTPANRSAPYTATFGYTATDGAVTATATVSVYVDADNDPPEAVDDIGNSSEGTSLTIHVLGNDQDPEGASLSVASVGTPDVGKATTDGTTVTYTPENRSAPYVATFDYTATDGDATATATVTVYVVADNDPPSVSEIPNQTGAVGTATGPVPFTVSDPDTPLGSLSLSATSSNLGLVPYGSITFGGSGSDRFLTVTPTDGLAGATAITVTVTDGEYTSDEVFVLTIRWRVLLPLVGR